MKNNLELILLMLSFTGFLSSTLISAANLVSAIFILILFIWALGTSFFLSRTLYDYSEIDIEEEWEKELAFESNNLSNPLINLKKPIENKKKALNHEHLNENLYN